MFGYVLQCHHMLEKHEEDMEEFWFKVHAKDENVDMLEWLCINRIKGWLCTYFL